jgi:cellulase/cellobiase CelA1
MSRMRYRAVVVTLLVLGAALATGTTSAQAAPATGAPSQTVAETTAPGCSVQLTEWSNVYYAYVTVNGPLAGWSIPFTLPSGHQIITAWNTTVSVSGESATASNVSWNGNVGADQVTMFALVITRTSGDTRRAEFPTCTTTA